MHGDAATAGVAAHDYSAPLFDGALEWEDIGPDRDENGLRPMPYPHASPISSAVGVTIPGSAVYDPAGCAERGVPAFTAGSVTHFGSLAPSL